MEKQNVLIPVSATPWKTIQTSIEGGVEWHCPECGWRKRWTKDGGLMTLVRGNPSHAHRGMPMISGRNGGGGLSKSARGRARKEKQRQAPQPELQLPN
jgi:hypothetical protein